MLARPTRLGPAVTGRRLLVKRALIVSTCFALGVLLLVAMGAGTLWARNLDLGPWAPSGAHSYLWQNSTEAAFLDLTINGSSLTGTLADVELRDTKVRSQRFVISGSVKGGRATLQLNSSWLGSLHPRGQYQGASFMMRTGESGGSSQSLTFVPSNYARYNSVAQRFEQTAQANAQAAAALARADQQIDQAAQAFNTAYTQVQNDGANLPNDQYLGDAVQAADQAEAGLLTTAGDKLKVANEGASALSCRNDAGTVSNDAETVQGYQSSVSNDERSLQADITNTSNDATALQNAQDAYEQAQSGDPGRRDQVPSASQVTTSIQSLQSVQRQALQTMTGYANWVAQDSSLAQGLAQQAQTVCG